MKLVSSGESMHSIVIRLTIHNIILYYFLFSHNIFAKFKTQYNGEKKILLLQKIILLYESGKNVFV